MKPIEFKIPEFDVWYEYSKKNFGFMIRVLHIHNNHTSIDDRHNIWILGFLFQWALRFGKRKQVVIR